MQRVSASDVEPVLTRERPLQGRHRASEQHADAEQRERAAASIGCSTASRREREVQRADRERQQLQPQQRPGRESLDRRPPPADPLACRA